MKRLNIFIDESGSVLPLDGNIPINSTLSDSFYVVSLVFVVDNDASIYETIREINELKYTYGISEAIHYGPLIRRKNDFYKQFTIDEVRKIFYRTSKIISNLSIYYSTIVLNKRDISTKDEFESYLIDNFANIYYSNPYINQIKEIKVYYDNGQECVSTFIKEGIFKYFKYHNNDIFNARQKDYALLQIADYICTMKIIDLKRKFNASSTSEKAIFNNTKKYKRNIIDRLYTHKIK